MGCDDESKSQTKFYWTANIYEQEDTKTLHHLLLETQQVPLCLPALMRTLQDKFTLRRLTSTLRQHRLTFYPGEQIVFFAGAHNQTELSSSSRKLWACQS